MARKKKMAKKKMAKKKIVKNKKIAKKKIAKKKIAKKKTVIKAKKKGNGNGPYTPNICSDFTGDNGHQVAFQGIPTGGCTLTQDGANNVFPFSPNNTGNNGLKYITLYPGDITTISVPALNQQYRYVVTCCPPNQGTHTVTVP